MISASTSSATLRVFENGALKTGNAALAGAFQVHLVGADAEATDADQPGRAVQNLGRSIASPTGFRRSRRLSALRASASPESDLGCDKILLYPWRRSISAALGCTPSSRTILILLFARDVAAMNFDFRVNWRLEVTPITRAPTGAAPSATAGSCPPVHPGCSADRPPGRQPVKMRLSSCRFHR